MKIDSMMCVMAIFVSLTISGINWNELIPMFFKNEKSFYFTLSRKMKSTLWKEHCDMGDGLM